MSTELTDRERLSFTQRITAALADRDEWHRLALRHEVLRRQAEVVCEERTAQLAATRAGTETPRLLVELRLMRAERDDALRAHIRSLFGGAGHVMVRSPVQYSLPVRCTTHEEVAMVWGRGYLYPDQPSSSANSSSSSGA